MRHRYHRLCLAAILACLLLLPLAPATAAAPAAGHDPGAFGWVLDRIAAWVAPWSATRERSETYPDMGPDGSPATDVTPVAPADSGPEATSTSGTEGEIYPDMDPNG